MNEFVQALKRLTLRQLKIVKNLTNALYDVQKEIEEGEKVVNS